jgi:hypothetical protein
MADNTTTYNAVIDVETKGAKNVELLNKTVSTSIGEFDNLNEAISKTQDTLGKIDPNTKEFKELSSELTVLKDRLQDTEIQSKRFTEALADQPGVIGLVGGSLEGLRGTFKVFMANPIIAVVTGIAGAFLAMRESLTKTSEGQETLNRISEAFGKIMGPVFALIEKIALPLFEGFAFLLEKVASGFNRFAKFLGVSSDKIEEASRNSSEVLQTAYDEETKRQEELTKTAEDEAQKRIDAAQREADEIARIKEQAAAIQLEAELSLLDERSRALLEREMRFQEERDILIRAGYTDLSALESEFYGDQLEIKKRFDNLQTVSTIKAKGTSVKMGLDIQKKGDIESLKVQKQTSKVSQDINMQEQQAKLAVISSALGAVAQAVGENTVAGKALAIAQATIDTYAGATLALKTYPPPFGAIAAGVVIAAGLLNVKKIISTKVPKPPGTNLKGAGGGGGGGAPSVPSTPVPQIETAAALAGPDTGTQIAESIATATERPVQAYVVSTEVSSTQALDRRTNSAASFG